MRVINKFNEVNNILVKPLLSTSSVDNLKINGVSFTFSPKNVQLSAVTLNNGNIITKNGAKSLDKPALIFGSSFKSDELDYVTADVLTTNTDYNRSNALSQLKNITTSQNKSIFDFVSVNDPLILDDNNLVVCYQDIYGNDGYKRENVFLNKNNTLFALAYTYNGTYLPITTEHSIFKLEKHSTQSSYYAYLFDDLINNKQTYMRYMGNIEMINGIPYGKNIPYYHGLVKNDTINPESVEISTYSTACITDNGYVYVLKDTVVKEGIYDDVEDIKDNISKYSLNSSLQLVSEQFDIDPVTNKRTGKSYWYVKEHTLFKPVKIYTNDSTYEYVPYSVVDTSSEYVIQCEIDSSKKLTFKLQTKDGISEKSITSKRSNGVYEFYDNDASIVPIKINGIDFYEINFDNVNKVNVYFSISSIIQDEDYNYIEYNSPFISNNIEDTIINILTLMPSETYLTKIDIKKTGDVYRGISSLYSKQEVTINEVKEADAGISYVQYIQSMSTSYNIEYVSYVDNTYSYIYDDELSSIKYKRDVLYERDGLIVNYVYFSPKTNSYVRYENVVLEYNNELYGSSVFDDEMYNSYEISIVDIFERTKINNSYQLSNIDSYSCYLVNNEEAFVNTYAIEPITLANDFEYEFDKYTFEEPIKSNVINIKEIKTNFSSSKYANTHLNLDSNTAYAYFEQIEYEDLRNNFTCNGTEILKDFPKDIKVINWGNYNTYRDTTISDYHNIYRMMSYMATDGLSSPISITINCYEWKNGDDSIYTLNEIPKVDDNVYKLTNEKIVPYNTITSVNEHNIKLNDNTLYEYTDEIKEHNFKIEKTQSVEYYTVELTYNIDAYNYYDDNTKSYYDSNNLNYSYYTYDNITYAYTAASYIYKIKDSEIGTSYTYVCSEIISRDGYWKREYKKSNKPFVVSSYSYVMNSVDISKAYVVPSTKNETLGFIHNNKITYNMLVDDFIEEYKYVYYSNSNVQTLFNEDDNHKVINVGNKFFGITTSYECFQIGNLTNYFKKIEDENGTGKYELVSSSSIPKLTTSYLNYIRENWKTNFYFYKDKDKDNDYYYVLLVTDVFYKWKNGNDFIYTSNKTPVEGDDVYILTNENKIVQYNTITSVNTNSIKLNNDKEYEYVETNIDETKKYYSINLINLNVNINCSKYLKIKNDLDKEYYNKIYNDIKSTTSKDVTLPDNSCIFNFDDPDDNKFEDTYSYIISFTYKFLAYDYIDNGYLHYASSIRAKNGNICDTLKESNYEEYVNSGGINLLTYQIEKTDLVEVYQRMIVDRQQVLKECVLQEDEFVPQYAQVDTPFGLVNGKKVVVRDQIYVPETYVTITTIDPETYEYSTKRVLKNDGYMAYSYDVEDIPFKTSTYIYNGGDAEGIKIQGMDNLVELLSVAIINSNKEYVSDSLPSSTNATQSYSIYSQQNSIKSLETYLYSAAKSLVYINEAIDRNTKKVSYAIDNIDNDSSAYILSVSSAINSFSNLSSSNSISNTSNLINAQKGMVSTLSDSINNQTSTLSKLLMLNMVGQSSYSTDASSFITNVMTSMTSSVPKNWQTISKIGYQIVQEVDVASYKSVGFKHTKVIGKEQRVSQKKTLKTSYKYDDPTYISLTYSTAFDSNSSTIERVGLHLNKESREFVVNGYLYNEDYYSYQNIADILANLHVSKRAPTRKEFIIDVSKQLYINSDFIFAYTSPNEYAIRAIRRADILWKELEKANIVDSEETKENAYVSMPLVDVNKWWEDKKKLSYFAYAFDLDKTTLKSINETGFIDINNIISNKMSETNTSKLEIDEEKLENIAKIWDVERESLDVETIQNINNVVKKFKV